MDENASTPTTPFGARFLDAIRGEGLPLSGFDYGTIQELKRADREETIRLLRSGNATMSYAMIQRLKRDEPKQLARRVAADARLATQQMTTLMIIMMMT